MSEGKKKSLNWGLIFIGLFVFGILGFFGFIAAIVIGITSGTGSQVAFTSSPIAVVKVEGPIFQSDELVRELEDIKNNKDIKVVVIRLNTPGGAVGPSQEIYKQVLRLKDSGKKVVASMSTITASGGYYIACAADKIVANPGTITGSIGVIMETFGIKELFQKLYIERRVIKSGAYKDAGSPFKDLSEEDRKYLQTLSDDMYQQFLSDVSKARNIPMSKMTQIAQGKIYSGLQAKKVNLVDELGNLFDAIDLAKKIANLPQDAKVKWPRKPRPFEALFNESAVNYFMDKFLSKFSNQHLPSWKLEANRDWL